MLEILGFVLDAVQIVLDVLVIASLYRFIKMDDSEQ